MKGGENVDGEYHDCEPFRDFQRIHDDGVVYRPFGGVWFVGDGKDTINDINYCPFCGKWLYEGVKKAKFNDYLKK